MKEIKFKSRFLLPIIVFVLVAILVSGTLYIRSSLMNLTMEERYNQLEEMVTQIRANLSNGLQTHWNLVGTSKPPARLGSQIKALAMQIKKGSP